MRSWKKPTPEQIEKTVSLIQDPTMREYFFVRLENPQWVDELHRRGVFSNPPGPLVEPGSSDIRFQPWPELGYLVRMAAECPQTVVEVLAEIPKSDNPLVNRNILDAALKMDVNHAAALVPRVLGMLSGNDEPPWNWRSWIDHLLCQLIGKLSSRGRPDEALLLAREILQLRLSRSDPVELDDGTFLDFREPETVFEKLYFQEVLSQIIPSLVLSRPFQTVGLLLAILGRGMEYTLTSRIDTMRDDGFRWRRPAIQRESSSLGARNPTQAIITAARDAARNIWAHYPDLREELLQELATFKWKIGIRLALDVLADADARPFRLARLWLVNRKNFDDLDVRAEYKRLLQVSYSSQSAGDKELILTWIDEEGKGSDHLSSDDDVTDAEQRARHARLRQRDLLAQISAHLDSQWKRKFDALCTDPDLGSLRDSDDGFRVGTWVGPTSPKSSGELIQMDIDDITDFLKTWIPSGTLLTHSRRGLARELGEMTRKRSQYMSQNAANLIGHHPTYISEFMSGMREAIRSGANVSWVNICELSEWVVSQPRDFEAEKNSFDDDVHWGECRKYIAQVLDSGFNAGEYATPFYLRPRVWRIIKSILDDPDPSPSHEKDYGPPNMDPITLAINSTRGSAMKTVMEYVLWTYRSMELQQTQSKDANDLDMPPEARRTLDKFLEPNFEPSIAVRAVYGWHFPYLVKIDAQWAEDAVSSIFPIEEEYEYLMLAAWESYLVSNKLYISVFRILEPHYRWAVTQLPSAKNGWSHREPDEALAEHLLLLYLNGDSDLDDSDALIHLLYKNADPELRQYANSWVGRGICGDEITEYMIGRARQLWDWRLEIVRNMQDESAAKELQSFVWWLRSDRFDVRWAAERLYQSLRLAGRVDLESSVLEWLSRNAGEAPLLAIQSLRILAENSYQESWILDEWVAHIKDIITTARNSEDIQANFEASGLSEILASRRLFDIEDIR